MAVDPSVRIDLAAEFTGKKAFKQADTATDKLTKGVKKLGGALGLAFGAAAVINFSKKAVKAFAEDEAAAIRLTRAVENLGIGFSNPAISKFIADLERSAGIADDVLRPAFQSLLTTTGSLTQSQKLLNNAITISRASGIDLATVSEDLAKGYVGVTKGLAKYNTGLTKTELSTKSFSNILDVLLNQSAGAAADYLGTTAYQMDVLGIATSNASEIIGGGLVDAFAAIGGGTQASDAAQAIEDIATAVAFLEVRIGNVIGAIPTLLQNLKNLPKSIFEGFVGAQTGVIIKPKPVETKSALELTKEQQAKRLAALEANAAARAKALALLQTNQLANSKKQAENERKRLLLEKAKAALSKAAAIFDLQKIQIAAALKGKISEEEKTRLLLMQAILDEDADKAEALSKKLDLLIDKNVKLAEALAAIAATKDPFTTWAGSLSLALIELGKYGKTMADISTTTFIPGVNFNPTQNADRNYDMAVAAVAAEIAVLSAPIMPSATNNPFAGLGGPIPGIDFNPNQNRDRTYDAALSAAPITIIVEGNVLDGDDFTEKVNDALLNANRTGMPRTPAGFLID